MHELKKTSYHCVGLHWSLSSHRTLRYPHQFHSLHQIQSFSLAPSETLESDIFFVQYVKCFVAIILFPAKQ